MKKKRKNQLLEKGETECVESIAINVGVSHKFLHSERVGNKFLDLDLQPP